MRRQNGIGASRKPPDSKTNYATAFFDSIGHFQTQSCVPARSVCPSTTEMRRLHRHVGFVQILLQKSAAVDGLSGSWLSMVGFDPPTLYATHATQCTA